MSEWKYILGEKTDGTKIVMSSNPADTPFDPVVVAAFDRAVSEAAKYIRVQPGENLQEAIRSAKPGQIVQLARGGVWANRFKIESNGVTLGAFGQGPLPKIGSLAIVESVSDLLVEDIDIDATVLDVKDPNRQYGIVCHQPECQRLTFRRVRIAGHEDCVSIHHPDLDKAPVNEWSRKITFQNCHFLDAADIEKVEHFRGQGIFVCNVDELLIRDCLIDGNGDPKKANIFRHGAYIAFDNSGVVVSGCIVTRNASYGLQVRAAGSTVSDCFFFDNAICAMLNGKSGILSDCVGVRGHFQKNPDGTLAGRNGFDLHIGVGRVTNNLLLGPTPTKIPAGASQHPVGFSIGPRKKKAGWEWDGPCNPRTNNNLEFPAKPFDAQAEILKARQTFDILPIRMELFARAHAAARK